MKVFAKTCRICLKNFEKNEDLKSVFENDETNIKIAKKIYDVSGIFIEKDSNTPEKICKLCVETLNISYNFKNQCLQSDIKLKLVKCNDDMYVEHILNVESDYINETFLKIEPDTSIINLKEEEGTQINECDYGDYKIISAHGYVPNGCFESESDCKNQDFDTSLEIVSCDVDEEYIEESCEYIEEFESETPKQLKNIVKVGEKDQSTNIRKLKAKWWEKYDFLIPSMDEKTAICTTCECILTIAQKGQSAVIRHMKTGKHMANIAGNPKGKKKTRLKSKDENIHICDMCGNKYTTLHMLRRHLKYHSDILDYECEICKKKFRQMMQLQRHMRTHTGEKPYSCKYCNKAIRDYSTKIRHERMHTGERPYVCSTCNKSFQYPFVLKNHMKTHTGEKLFECFVCNKSFTLKKHLTSHLETILHKSQMQKLGEKALSVKDKPNCQN